VLLGFDLGAFAIGADVFLEYAGYGATVGNDKASGYIATPGARASGKFNAAGAEVMAKIGLGVPMIGASGLAGSDKLSFNNSLYIEAGAEATIPLDGADLIFGVCYTRSDYRVKTGNASAANAYASSLLNGYLGAEFNFMETAVATLGYSLNRTDLVTRQPDVSDSPVTSDPVSYSHGIYAGVENAWDKAWIFDSFQLRGGALYRITANGRTVTGTQNANSDVSFPSERSPVLPSIGAGVSKAFLTLDLNLTPGDWGGLFTGPGVAAVTATVKF